MKHITSGYAHPNKSTITMLPLIDLNPSDESCMYSTLLHIKDQAKQLKIVTPCVTFDQPLWIKAVEIVAAKSLGIVVRLGGFHCLMSFVGSIGTLMEGSGLQQLMETIYGKNTVQHIFSGKAISRALRSHFLVDSALRMKLIKRLWPDENEDNQISGADPFATFPEDGDTVRGTPMSQKDADELGSLYEGLGSTSLRSDELEQSTALNKLQTSLEKLKNSLSSSSRTAKLWLSYIDYVGIVKMFIRAERTSNWEEHLAAMEKMLNLYAATGHYNYAKSARLYLQMMLALEDKYPWLYKHFKEHGHHCV